jgi:septum site-determining protein MinD
LHENLFICLRTDARGKVHEIGGLGMGEVIVITSGKGGVGKTTTTANLGVGLALQGKKIVLIDTDIGLRNLDVVMGLENRIVYDLVDVIEGSCRVKQALIKDKRFDGLYLLPAAQTRDKNAVSPEQMEKLCLELKEEFDYVLIDCPAGIEQGFKNAIAGADRAFVVTTPEVSAVRDADRIIGLLEANEVRGPRLIINRLRPDMVRRGDMMTIEDIIDILAIELIGVIPDDENIIISTNRGEPAVADAKSHAGLAYRNITRRILGEEIPYLDLTAQDNLLSKMKKLFGFKPA